MSNPASNEIAIIGIDIGKNSFHVVGLDKRGAIVLRQKWSRGQVEARLANMPPCLIGMEACVGAHHLSRVLSQILCMDEVGLERRRGLPRQRIELLRWTQFSRRPQLPFSDHVHELDPGERHCS
jgi:transposase